MSNPATPDEIVAAWLAFPEHAKPKMKTWAESLGFTHGQVRNYIGRYQCDEKKRKAIIAGVAPANLGEREWTEEKGNASERFAWSKDTITYDELVARSKADLTVWRVKKWKCTAGKVPMKLRQGQDKKGRAQPDLATTGDAWWVWIEWERIISKEVEDGTRAFFLAISKHVPTYDPTPIEPVSDPHLALVGLTDIHFGKLGWGRETGEDYDLSIARSRFRFAVVDLMRKVRGYPVAQWLVPIGSDLAHIDGQRNMTTAGTPQDVDTRYDKIIETIELEMFWAIEELAKTAPVLGMLVKGNHDEAASTSVARSMWWAFRNHPRVTINCEPTPRKYYRYGRTLIGMTHGNMEKRADLPITMATEAEDLWAGAISREWICGHEHQAKVTSHTGVIVRTLRSLAGRDYWHAAKAYVGNDQAAEIYLYSENEGFSGHFISRPRKQIATNCEPIAVA